MSLSSPEMLTLDARRRPAPSPDDRDLLPSLITTVRARVATADGEMVWISCRAVTALADAAENSLQRPQGDA